MATTTINLDIGLDGLSDVDVTGKVDGNLLAWDDATSKWVVTAPPSGGGGIFGIADATGEYTYYDKLQDAIDTAVSGDTIQVFADYIETDDVTIVLKNGVNINGNGHSYILDRVGTTTLMNLSNSGTTSCNIHNYNITSINGDTGSVTLFLRTSGNGYLDFTGSKLKNLGGGRCVSSIAQANYHISNLYAEADSNAAGWINGSGTNNEIRDCTFISNTGNSTLLSLYRVINTYGFSNSGVGLLLNNARAINCVGRSEGGNGIETSRGILQNCTGYSTGGNGINATNSVTLIDCLGYSTASDGINLAGTPSTLLNCQGFSTASIGILAPSSRHKINNCIAYSTANNGLITNISSLVVKNSTITSTSAPACSRGGYINCVIQCSWDNANGHGIATANNDVYNCTIITENEDANAIQSNTSISIFVVQNTYKGMTTPLSATITNLQTNTPDASGNILIG